MTKTINILSAGLLIMMITSCGLFNKRVVVDENIDGEVNKRGVRIDKEAILITDSINHNSLKYKSFTANFSGNFDNNDQTIPLKGVLRIKKDEFIWISLRPALSIELGRVLLTKDSIKYIDRMKNEYLAENYSYIKKAFGFDLNYDIIQSAFTNSFFLYPPGNKINSYFLLDNESANANTLNAAGIFYEKNLSHSIVFSHNHYFITENKIHFLTNNKRVSFIYSNFNDFSGTKFPNNILLNINDNTKKSKLDIKYTALTANKEFDQNFRIPDSYKRVHFE